MEYLSKSDSLPRYHVWRNWRSSDMFNDNNDDNNDDTIPNIWPIETEEQQNRRLVVVLMFTRSRLPNTQMDRRGGGGDAHSKFNKRKS